MKYINNPYNMIEGKNIFLRKHISDNSGLPKLKRALNEYRKNKEPK
jgi:hypothetical protein